MTKASIISLVTSKLQFTDTDSNAIATSSFDARDEMIWDSNLWKESLATETQSITASTSTVTLGSTLQFPVAVRWDECTIDPIRYESVFQIDPNSFENTGTPTRFIRLADDSSGNARIRLLETPDQSKDIFILAKLKYASLATTDSPRITATNNALIAFVEGDMLEYKRQYGKAQAKFSEANSLLAAARDVETWQESDFQQVIPVSMDERDSDFFE